MGKPQLSNIVRSKVDEINADTTSVTRVCTFSPDNPANNPSHTDIIENYFTDFTQMSYIFKNLNNKKSSSFDGIPNIILKKLPPLYVYFYTIIFNNCLTIHTSHPNGKRQN